MILSIPERTAQHDKLNLWPALHSSVEFMACITFLSGIYGLHYILQWNLWPALHSSVEFMACITFLSGIYGKIKSVLKKIVFLKYVTIIPSCLTSTHDKFILSLAGSDLTIKMQNRCADSKF